MTEAELKALEQDQGEGEKVLDSIDNDEIKKPLLTEIARKKHWREKAEKERVERLRVEEENKQLKVDLAAKPKDTPPAQGDDIETVLKLRAEGKTDAEILQLRKYAKRMNTTIDEVAADPFIKAGLDAERAKASVVQGTPSPSNRTPKIDNKSWGELSAAERDKSISKAFEQAMKGAEKGNE